MIVLQFNSKIGHIFNSVNTEADFLSRLKLRDTEKIRLKIWEGVQATTIEVTTSFADVADEKQFFFNQADNENESDEQTLQQKRQSRQDAWELVANKELS